MFTGIVEEIGTIEKIVPGAKSAILWIRASKVLEGTVLGDSIAVNGVCLTVTGQKQSVFTADVMAETLRRSSLGQLKAGSKVNLERAMAANGRFGGHMVSGHIDGTGVIESVKREDNAVWVEIGTSERLLKYIIEKGSIGIDGISLTVAKVTNHSFSVSVIPHTKEKTTLLQKKTGELVNLENDMVGKYIYHFMMQEKNGTASEDMTKGQDKGRTSGGITMDFLIKNGF